MSRRGKRWLDLSLGLALVPFYLAARWAQDGAAEAIYRCGKDGRVLRLPRWRGERDAPSFFRDQLPTLPHLLRGDLSLVGPRPRRADFEDLPEEHRAEILSVAPGWISLYEVRRRANLPLECEWEVDLEYVRGNSSDLSLLLRALLVGRLAAEEAVPASETVSLLGIHMDNLTYESTLERLAAFSAQRESHQVNFVNAHCANVAQKDPEYLEILGKSSLCLADGSGVRLGARLLGQSVAENVNGTDLFPRLCRQLNESQGSLALLGGKPGIAQAVADWVRQNYPHIEVRFVAHGYFSEGEEAALVQGISDSNCDVLLVALGVPGQEKWLDRHRQDLGVGVALAVGGLFDFYSGTLPRAPLWLRELGLEWSFRLYQEPRRLWQRYVIGNFVFLGHVLQERWGKQTS